jgi:hypothetical protein
MKKVLKLIAICSLFIIPQIKGTGAIFRSEKITMNASLTTAENFNETLPLARVEVLPTPTPTEIIEIPQPSPTATAGEATPTNTPIETN